MFGVFEEPNKLYVGPDRDLIILNDSEVQVLMVHVCKTLEKHAWNKDQDPWKCTRCKKKRRPRKSRRQMGYRSVEVVDEFAPIEDTLRLIL